jgi:hypothetical protein
LTGAAQRLQTLKNLEGESHEKYLSAPAKVRAAETDGVGSIPADVRKQWEEECYSAMNQEIMIKGLFKTRTRGFPWKSTAPLEEELRQQSQWVVDEMGQDRNFAAVNDKSWIWQMYCLLSGERRVQITYQEYETFMLGAVKRLEKGVREEAQAKRIARILGVSVEKRVTTSHGQENMWKQKIPLS